MHIIVGIRSIFMNIDPLLLQKKTYRFFNQSFGDI